MKKKLQREDPCPKQARLAEESQQTGSAVGRVIEVSPQTPSPTGSDTQNLASYGAEEFVTDITTAMTRGAWYDIL
nr:hypothetical protein BaRGS_021201 [Batillaria attramentaria]